MLTMHADNACNTEALQGWSIKSYSRCLEPAPANKAVATAAILLLSLGSGCLVGLCSRAQPCTARSHALQAQEEGRIIRLRPGVLAGWRPHEHAGACGPGRGCAASCADPWHCAHPLRPALRSRSALAATVWGACIRVIGTACLIPLKISSHRCRCAAGCMLHCCKARSHSSRGRFPLA